MSDAKITVLMPCFNVQEYVADAIRSVLCQSYQNFEFLIINDGSTDRTAEVIKAFEDSRIVLIEQEKQGGIAAALNLGLQRAEASYIARFDADDICFPDRLRIQYDFMQANPEYIVIGSAAQYLDDAGNYVFTHYPLVQSNSDIQQLSDFICPFIHASVMYRKDSIAKIAYNVHAHGFEDHLLWLQLKGMGKMLNMREPLISVRINPGSYTIDEKKRSPDFRRIKWSALKKRSITRSDGEMLLQMIRKQDIPDLKRGAYHSLLAKKFLWNNYDPLKARINIRKAIRLNAFDFRDYLLFAISYFPKNMINRLYSISVSSR